MSQAETASLEPIATGDLALNPLAHLLLYLHRRAQGGTLVVTDPRGGQTRVLFNNGNPFMAQLPWQADDMVQGIVPLCGLAGGSYAFYEEELVPEPSVVGEADPYAIIGASLDRYIRDAVVEPVVEQFLGVRLRIQRGKRLPRLKLPGSDMGLIDLIRAEPINAQAMLDMSPLTPERTKRLIYALVITHAVAPFDTQQLAAHQKRQGRGDSLRTPAATSNAPATFKSVKRPNALNASFVNVAPTTPSGHGLPAPSPVNLIGKADAMDVDNTIKLAEHMLKNRKHGEALFPLERIQRHHPERADIYALRAYIMFDRDARNGQPMPEKIRKLTEQALELDPEEPRAKFLRAIELVRDGDDVKASRLLRDVVENDPHNIEAKRELHLLGKRAS